MASPVHSGSDSDNTAIRTPAAAGVDTEWVESAVGRALDLKDSLVGSAVSFVQAADYHLRDFGAALSVAASDARRGTMDMMEWMKTQYIAREEVAFGKIKEGVLVAASHPNLSCGIAAGAGLVLFKRPRRFLIHSTRRMFMSQESLLSDAEAKVNVLRQSVNLVKNESKKLEDRALRAEQEIQNGQMELIQQGRKIQNGLRQVTDIEEEAIDLRGRINELPKRDASQFQSEVSSLISEVKKERNTLNAALSKIINHGIPI